ncbi:MAG TPA: SDR family oxidoreductase [Solirubrobacteraceae bacterium]|jgi:NAD(P)-dependent dehydrogenase (short-subunit alcohol dehydrogenase family)
MGVLEGRVAVITGASNGIGREHALLFASEGARVVVNDLGGGPDGTGADARPADVVADEIVAAGGEAVANHDDVADFAAAGRLIEQAVETFGRLDVLVNNAGILRDAFFHRMTEEEWDLVVRVHLKGHFSTLRHAADHWRARSKAGEDVQGAVINTTSASGTYLANPGQANYGAAKAAIAALTLITAAELGRVGVRVNAIAPAARTRLTADVPGMVGELMKKPADGSFDTFDPAHVSPLVAYLARADCTITGKLFAVQGGAISELAGWSAQDAISTDGDWTQEALEAALAVAA